MKNGIGIFSLNCSKFKYSMIILILNITRKVLFFFLSFEKLTNTQQNIKYKEDGLLDILF